MGMDWISAFVFSTGEAYACSPGAGGRLERGQLRSRGLERGYLLRMQEVGWGRAASQGGLLPAGSVLAVD